MDAGAGGFTPTGFTAGPLLLTGFVFCAECTDALGTGEIGASEDVTCGGALAEDSIGVDGISAECVGSAM